MPRRGSSYTTRPRRPSMEKIHSRTIRVTDNLFLSSLPSLGAYDQQVSVLTLIQNKVTMVVTAVEDDELVHAKCLDYLDSLFKAGMNVVHCPVADMTAPALESAAKMATLVKREIRRGGRVAFQCHEALGRAPCLLSSYMVITGMEPEHAVRLIRSVQPQSFLTLDQLRFPIAVDEMNRTVPVSKACA